MEVPVSTAVALSLRNVEKAFHSLQRQKNSMEGLPECEKSEYSGTGISTLT